jgi:PAS domain S-box-containing protein
MSEKKPTYEELKKKLAEAEELLAKIQRSEINPIKSERDTAILSTKELAEAYLASEQNFKNSLDTCPLGVRIITEDGELIYANKATLDIFGYHTVEELAAVKRHELYTPESYAAYQERKRKRKLKQYVPGEYELSIRCPDGNVRDLMVFRREVMWGGEKQYMAMYEDITERKKAEEALRESEDKYHSLIEHSNDGIIFIQEGLIQYCNSKMLEIGGYTTEDIYGKPFTDFIVPEQKENVEEIYRKRIAGLKVPERYELDFISKGGSVVNTEISASLFYFRQKLVDIAVVRDITERKQAEEALKESQEMFSLAFRDSPNLMLITSLKEGRIIEANDTYCRTTGYTRAELIGHTTLELDLWYDPEQRMAIIESLKDGEAVSNAEVKFREKSGDIRTVNLSMSKISGKNEPYLISIAADITKRKRAEEELKSREKFLDSIIEKTPNALWVSDEKGTIIRMNQAIRNILHVTDEEVIGKYNVLKDSQVIEQGFLPLVKCVYDEGKTVSFTLDYQTAKEKQIKPARTTHKVLEIVMSAIKNEGSKVINVICQEKDITEQEKAKEASQESEARFRALFETMAQGVVYQDAEGKLISANPAAERILGLTLDQILGRTSVDARWKSTHEDGTDFHGEEHPSMVALHTGKPVENVVMGIFNPIINERRWILINAIPEFRKGERTPYRAYTTFTDITEQKQAEKALQESEERYRLLFENSKDAILLTSPEGGILAANPEACRMLGRSEAEIRRIGRSSIIDTSDPRLELALEKRRSTGEFSGELTGIHADGTKFPIDLSSRVFYDKDGKARTSMIIRDITERKRMEEQVERDREEIKLIIDSTPILVFYKDTEGKLIRVNKAFATALNMTEEDMMGKTVFDLYSKNIAQVMADDDQKVYKSGRSKLNIIEQYESASGLRWVQTDKIPIFDKDNKVIGLAGFAQDITERKNAEEALRKSEERLRSIFSAAPVGIGMAVNRVFTEVNENFCKMLGYTRDELIGQSGRLVYPTDKDYEYVGTEKYHELTTKGTSTMEMRIRHKDGTVLNALLSASALDPNDLSRGVTFTALDITERIRAEEAIKESEERFNTAFHASPNMMVVIALEEGRIIDANAEHTRITGYERREVIGKTTLDLNLWVNPEQRKEFYRIINTEGRLKNYEVLMRTKSGEIRTLLFSAEKIMLRGINCMVVSALDITERKEAEERINHLNLTLHSIRNVNQLITREKDRSLLIQKVCDSLVESQSFKSAWIVLLDENQQPSIWAGANVSKEFPDLVKLTKQSQMPHCMQKALKQKKVVITEDPHTMCKGCPALGADLDTGSMTIRLEIEGKTYGVFCTTIPKKLINDKEEISLFTEIATDIAFALRDIELVAANELQEQERLRMAKMESIGMLAGGIAHDFNNLLTGIMGNIGLVKTYISPSDPTYEMLDEAEVAAIRARDLTQQLLTFAKGGKPVKKLINTAEIIKQSAEFALRGSKAKLELSFPDDLWQIEADEGQISQVINNLVINADEAMPAGGTLKITAENLALKKSDALPVRGGNYVRIDIKDTGIGIAAGYIQRIFEPYFSTKQKGSGLGLTTAYSIVKNHGGIILIDSVLNEGSTFHIYLPATKKALKGAKKLTVDESGQAGGKVLIMDDEVIIRKMLKNMLSMAGYTVELSADGAEALKKYEQAKEARDPFNAVIMDLTIPGGMGGKEAVKKLLEIDPKAMVIVSSGYATDPIMSDYKKYGFKAVIAKPYSVKQLRDLLSRLLTKKKR